MKTKTLIIVAAAFGLIGAVNAEEGKKDRPHRKLPPKLIEKFDLDKDGKLNKEEREAAKKFHHEKMLEKFDADKDGELSDAEKEAMKADRKQLMLEHFDEDGDGQLTDDEKAAAKEEMRKRLRPDGERDHKRKGKNGKRGGEDEGASVLGE